ncbi:hypothetical protein [Haladaptatus sp. NG-SE-30]
METDYENLDEMIHHSVSSESHPHSSFIHRLTAFPAVLTDFRILLSTFLVPIPVMFHSLVPADSADYEPRLASRDAMDTSLIGSRTPVSIMILRTCHLVVVGGRVSDETSLASKRHSKTRVIFTIFRHRQEYMSEVGGEQESSHCSQCAFEQLKALYQLNVEAKRYADAAKDAYTNGLGANARLHSLRKKALYGLKRAILGALVAEDCVDTVRCHDIDGEVYYCLYVGEFSFHTPAEEWDEPPVDAPTASSKTLDSFDANPDNRTDHLVEIEALQRLTEQFETPNNYLPAPFVDHGYRSEFAGWSQFPGAIDEGDRVDGRFGRELTSSRA